MNKIPYLTQTQYDALYEQFLADEREYLGPSETTLGDGCCETTIKTMFEYVLLSHIRYSNAIADTSAKELLEKTIAQCLWYDAIDLEISSRISQLMYANVIILNANDLLGFKE